MEKQTRYNHNLTSSLPTRIKRRCSITHSKEAVYPGMALGQTVFLPDSKGNDVSHLHVSVIKLPEGVKAVSETGIIMPDENKFPIWGQKHTKDQKIWKNMINPFNYTDPIPWKGRY